jgi:hypothetical protein
MTKSEFLWTFPCFILATQYNRDPETGSVLFDEGFRVVALNLTGDGEKQVPISQAIGVHAPSGTGDFSLTFG